MVKIKIKDGPSAGRVTVHSDDILVNGKIMVYNESPFHKAIYDIVKNPDFIIEEGVEYIAIFNRNVK